MIKIDELRKVAIDCQWPTSPVTVYEILDRLERAEKERTVDEQRIAADC